ncbi:ABC transporter ATP-binding protein [Panacibacter ginsenosidivorans]|uniref:ABC transporter ATP-binding protein n=1 Tax=Panacibacter ginsenosidivorans TaxID=1813871 RepID=A0A5B8VBI3_9BACT|nr:ABC transporter ATP-binding protein [Panacibacter ginsenosidivorans]QEC67658.1 ABC transporter ATP-binding protein [Panacibacter ginsenosidivorans]
MKKYGRILDYLKAYKPNILLYFICILLSIVFSVISFAMLMPFMNLIFLGDQGVAALAKSSQSPIVQWINDGMVNIIQSGGVQGKINALLIICIIIFAATFFKNLFIYLSFYILNPIKNTIVNALRQEIYDKILRLPIGYFTEKRKGDLMSRTTNDLAEVESSVVGVLEGWITYPLQILAYLGVLLVLSPQLTIFVLIFIPVMGFIIGRITRSLKKQSLQVAEKSGESVSILDETLGGLRVIKAFNVENILRGKFFAVNNDLLAARNHISYRRDMASPMSEFLGVTMFCGILYFGGRLVLGQDINLAPSAFLTYLAMFYNIINPAKSLSTSFSNVQKGSSAMKRIDEVLNAPVTVDDNTNGKKITAFNESIEFRNVCFSYEDFSILKNINLTIKKGQTVALVGSSGAGKSTLADLVPRFHDVTAGELLIDGVNIKDYSLKAVRQLMGIVTQEPILFNDTIANNIALGKEDASEHEIIKAAKIANAHSFIENKEDSYQTNIGDRGSKLSGGERQRLTIARAVLKNPPILILDEATSSLDTESERLVQDAINNLMQDRTSIVIAHRLSTVRHANEIIVLQKGEIAERGTHDELLAKNGIYKRLVDMQEVK